MSNPAKKSAFPHASGTARVECAATTRATPAAAWNIFVDLDRWAKFTDMYGELRWTQGHPWQVGSRLRLELLRPVKFAVNRVITVFRPGDCVAWIDHSRSSTVEQWLTFEIDHDGRTWVRIVSQIVGSQPKVGGQPFPEFLKSNVELWLEGFCKECDRTAAAVLPAR